jgi:hypothetical protein
MKRLLGILLVVAGLLAFGWITAWALRGAAASKDAWLDLMITALVLFPMGAMGTTALVNGYFDPSPPVFHRARIVDKTVRRAKGGPAHYVVCASWNAPGETIEFLVSSAEYDRVVVGRSEMHVTTSAGWLGIEWIRARQLVIAPLLHGLLREAEGLNRPTTALADSSGSWRRANAAGSPRRSASGRARRRFP